MKIVTDILQQFSFSEQEAAIYLACLKLGEAATKDIAVAAEMSRTNAYFHIKNLTARGMLQQTREGKKMLFSAKSPGQLANYLSDQSQSFRKLVPLLETMVVSGEHMPKIEIYETTEGYFKIYEALSFLPEGSLIRAFEGKQAVTDEFDAISDKRWHRFFSRVNERNIITHALFTEETLAVPRRKLSKETMDALQARDMQVRSLPEKQLPIQEIVFMYANKVTFLFPDTSLIMTIEHEGICRVMASIFDALYAGATPVEWR